MKKVFWFVLIAVLSVFSLCQADFANYAGPQLEYISNAFPLLWNKPKKDVLRIMSIFPDYVCTDYGDQLGCTSKFNTDLHDNVYLNFFMDDYEEHHDNLWKVSVTADVQSAEQIQSLFSVLWIDGMRELHRCILIVKILLWLPGSSLLCLITEPFFLSNTITAI